MARARKQPVVAAPACLVDAVLGELRVMAAVVPGMEDSALAWVALAMAREVDDLGNSATSKSMCAARLMDALAGLVALVPEESEGDVLDELVARRAERLGRGA